MKIADAFQLLVRDLSTLYGEREARSIARLVLEDAFGVRNPRREDPLGPSQLTELREIQSRLLTEEPVQYVLGEADFYGLKFRVDRRVLIPRPETEELVHWILEAVKGHGPLSVLDIGAGSGCIPIALKKENPDLNVTAVDVSPEALELARENARRNQTEVVFTPLNILDESQWPRLGCFDLIVSNPPYITRAEQDRMGSNVLKYEPGLALFVEGTDPLLFYRKIAQLARVHLRAGGWLFFELNEFNAGKVLSIVDAEGFMNAELKQDLSGKERMLRARRPAD